ncbi:general secretion pathway protein D [Pseudoalteromonas lipolytica]|uniref:General secretion pathway protein D n=2 Tax=Pseudoalteromonas lipolytica TaxID=570156 RepID=A0ABY1GRD8_9GAMM|nr:general secretion pathway protein D [Pseudoalteromonas lipolytica LMEB 39]SFT78180.1 general secretion pathway protein D [Pseudoalteromonas lipolytica]
MIAKYYKGLNLVLCMSLLYGCAQTNEQLRDKELTVTKSVLKSSVGQKLDQEQTPLEQQEDTRYSNVRVQDLGGITKLMENAKQPPSLKGEPVTFAADEISIKEFTSRVFDELLAINYVISPQLAASNDRITLNISSPIERTEFYKTVIKALEESGVRTLRKDNILYLSRAGTNEQKNSIAIGIGTKESDIPETSGAITQIVPYVYSGSRNITSIMSKLSTAKVTVNSLQKLIILEGDRAEIIRAIKIVNMLDVPRAYGREIRLIEFANISPIEGIEQIEKLLEQDGMQISKEGDASFVPIPRINAFVAYAASEKIIDRITYWANKIDVPIAGDESQYFIYKPKYAKAEDMLESISTLLLGQKPNGGERSSAEGNKSTSASSGPIKFSIDKQQNALIFYTTNDEYRLVESLLKKMDVLPGQVILDVTILEVTLGDSMSSGIDWIYDNTSAKAEGATATLSSSGSLVAQVITGNWQVDLQWNDSRDDARVLSRPYFIVRDGESATITSGDQIPIITQTVESIGDSNNAVSNSVQYRSTGVNVAITPVINSRGVISLSVAMSVSDAKPNELGGSSSPKITNRAISTEVLSADGQTIALGGLIQERKSNYDNGVPGLKEIPLLGNLFKSQVDSMDRTELVMLITTKIVNSSSEVDEFSEAMTELYSAPITIK